MPPVERDAPRDLDRALRHQHSSSSDHGRALVPMWDSSDPERAPPPLPLNPQSPGVVSRAGTSSAIQSAHAALTEKARESAMLPPPLTKRIETSPERMLRGSSHRRLQSLTPSSVKDIGLMLENGRESPLSRSPEKSERPTTPSRSRDSYPFPETRPDRDEKAIVSSPVPGPSLTPIIRPTVRRPQQSILGENTPPQSATMLALQSMSSGQGPVHGPAPPPPKEKEPENPLANITNGSTAMVKIPQGLESLSNQILTLTNIATTLQKEMTNLSRRSRDNATDLLSLKEATRSRDEDIRKSLRDLINDAKHRPATRDPYGGPLLLEGRHHAPSSPTSLSKSVRPFSLPRIPSPNSFAASLDRDSLLSTPSLIADSPSAVALLEKIIRDMGTREGQDNILSSLQELSERLQGFAIAQKVDELLRIVKQNQQRAVISTAGGSGGGSSGGNTRNRAWSFSDDGEGSRRELDFTKGSVLSGHTGRLLPDTESRRSSVPTARKSDPLNEDVIKAIRTVKDSVAQGGGLTAEVKALVRELRGEVLGMGREIGRRLDEVVTKNTASSGQLDAFSKAEMTRVIEEGLAEMKEHMDDHLREHRRQSSATNISRESSIDYKEIYNSMRAALKDSQAGKARVPELRREDVVQAVKDAWEKYKPEIEIQQIGLERHEVLECLKEGLREYAPHDDRPPGATREEVFKAVVEALKHYVPPQVDTPATLSRDEILEAVRECLEEFEFPTYTGPEISREDMVDAVREGLHNFDFPSPAPPPPPARELTRDDVLDAVNASLHSFDFSVVDSSALVTQPLTKADVSEAVKQGLKSFDVTPDMMDAVKDGIKSANLPTDVYRAVSEALKSFDFASVYSSALVPHSDLSRVDVADAIKDGLDSLQISTEVKHAVTESLKAFDFASLYSSAIIPRSDLSRVDVADAVKDSIDSLNLSHNVEEAVKKGLQSVDFSSISSSALVPHSNLSRIDIADAVKEGLESLDLTSGMTRAVRDGLESFDFPSTSSSSALVPVSGDNDEILKRLQELRVYFDVQFQAVSDEAKQNMAATGRDTEQVLDATKDGFEKLRQDIETYVDRARGDEDPGETMAHLVRTLDGFREEIAELLASSTETSRDVLKGEIESLRDAVNSSLIPALPQAAHPGGSKEFIEALQEGLSTLRTDISTRPLAGVSEILDALQEGLGDIRHSIDRLHDKPADLTANDEILDALKTGLDSVRSDIDELREESKNDRALATIGDNGNAVIPAEPPLKHDDIKNLETLLTQLGAKVEALEAAPPPIVESLSKEDLTTIQEKLQNVADGVSDISSRSEPLEALVSMEDRVKTIQDAVTELLAREPVVASAAPSLSDPATREDVEAIETILRNTKARLDDLIDGEQAVNKEHIDLLETHILETRELLSTLKSSMEAVSRKEDITMVESLVTQIISSFDEMKERHEKALEDPERVTKTDVDAVEAICLDTKVVIEQMLKTDLSTMATKDDVASLESLLKEYREKVDTRTESDSKALEVRQAEMATVGERVAEVKSVLDDFHGLMRNKLEDGAKGIDAINGVLHAMSDTVRKNANISDDLKEMFDTMKIEFEDSRAGVVGAKMETDEKFQVTIDTMVAKLDERMNELFVKYDEFQLLQDERVAKGEERDVEMESAMVGTKAIAEELRSLIDTLGSTVTDSLEKMEEASKTVFERVEELVGKSDENHAEGKAEHELTREQVQEVVGKVDGLHGHFTESEPKILEAIQDVMLLVNQHFEHAKAATLAIEDKIEESKPPLLPPPEKYDDAAVREKLDQLVSHSQLADKAFEHLGAIPNVHVLVKQTAAELAAFVAEQTKRIADEHEDREKTLQDTIIALERRLEEKQQVESLITSLREEEARLKESIQVTLRAEQAELKEQFLANLVEEETRLKSANADLKAEQDNLREMFMTNLREEQARLMEMNVAIKEEQDQLKETFLSTLREEQGRLSELNDALREEHQVLKDTFLANLRDEELLLKETNASLRNDQEQLREMFIASLKEEEERLKEANDTLRQEQEQLKFTLREEHERLKVELLANLMEEEERLKDVNASLREEQDRIKEEFLVSFREEEQRLKDSLLSLRDEFSDLAGRKARVAADLSAAETALQIRREDVQFMEAKAEGLERRILEGVMDHSRVLLMAKQKRPGGRDSMSRKRVVSQKTPDTPANPPKSVEDTKSRTAFNIAMAAKSKLNAPTPPGASRRILSLSQITNNTPTGGIKRSQSVRTAVGPGRPRKVSWAGGSRAAKGYGDLEKDKENLQLKESDEDDDTEPEPEFHNPPPVDIVISRADSIFSDAPHDSPAQPPAEDTIQDDYDTSDLDDDRIDEASEIASTLRRSSRGTVITTTESYADSADYSGEEDSIDDVASDWTESAVGDESIVGSVAPSAAGVEA